MEKQYRGNTLLLNNQDKPRYLHCNEHSSVPIPIPIYDYTVINRSLPCDCQQQGGNVHLHTSLASCPSADKVDRSMLFRIVTHMKIQEFQVNSGDFGVL